MRNDRSEIGSSVHGGADSGERGLPLKTRFGHLLLGAALVAMGIWILPYQWARQDLILSAVGAALLGLGLWILVAAALLGRRVRSLEVILEVLSEMT